LSADCDLRDATSPADIQLARALFVEYAQWLNVDLCFQGFDAELKGLPGAYAPPRGCLVLAGPPGEGFACIALRPLHDAHGDGNGNSESGEIKRLFVRHSHRGQDCGHALVASVIARARTIGYRTLMLDTLEWMTAARSLYRSFGFSECAAYYANPLPGVIYMQLSL